MTKVGALFTQEIFTPSMKKVQDLTQLPESTGSNLQIWIIWDSGSKFALIDGIGEWDVFE